jgi:hypothetical protein
MTISSTATKPSPPEAAINDPAPGGSAHIRPVRSLLRLLPFARPALPALIGSAITAAVAMFCGLAFPLVIRQIIDGPITAKDISALWPLAGLLLVLGIVEAALFWVRRMLSARPTMRVEATTCRNCRSRSMTDGRPVSSCRARCRTWRPFVGSWPSAWCSCSST